MYVRQGTGAMDVFPMIFWQASSGSFLSSSSGSAVSVSSTWQRITLTATAPASATQFGFGARVTSTAANNEFYLDSALAELGGTLGNYFDGSSTAAGFTYAWTGTAHASTSAETPDTSTPAVVEVVNGTKVASDATTVSSTLSNAIVSGDVVAALVTSNQINGNHSLGGLGATWTRVGKDSIGVLDLWIGTGATTAGTVTATQIAGSSGGFKYLNLWHVRGTTDVYVGGVDNAAADTLVSTAMTAGPGQIFIGSGYAESSANTFKDPNPATGWVNSDDLVMTTNRQASRVYRIPATSESHYFSTYRASSTAHPIVRMVVGTETVGNAISSTFSSEGTLTSTLAYTKRISSALSGSGTLTSVLGRFITSSFSGTGTLSASLTRHIQSALSASGTLSSTLSVPRTNLFTHPSAEGVGITWTTSIGTLTVERTTEQAWVGTESYKFTSGTTTSVEATTPTGTNGFPVVGGKAYTVSLYTRAATTARNIRSALHWYDAAGASISSSSQGDTLNSTTEWTRETTTATAPANAAFAAVKVRVVTASAVGEVHYFDGFLLEQASSAGTYFDGDTLTSGMTHAWTGTPHASKSTEVAGGGNVIASAFSGSGTLSASLAYTKRIDSAFSASGTLTSELDYERTIASEFSATGTLTSELVYGNNITSSFAAEGVLYSELFYTAPPAELGSTPLGKLVSFSVSTSAVPLNPAEGSGAAPSVNAGYIKGVDPEFALGETNTLSHGTVGTYEGEIVRLSLPEGSDVASVSQDTALTLLNTERNLFPFIDAAPSVWTAARAIDYWSQQCGLFYDKVPGDCIAYASGFGHVDSYGASTTARFYEKANGATSTAVLNGRSVKTLGSAVTGTTALHELPEGTVPVSVPRQRKLVASIGLGLRGTGRTSTVTWNMIDAKDTTYAVSVAATSAGLITASLGGVPVDSTSVAADGNYRITFSIERASDTAVVGKLIVHTDDLAGSGALAYLGAATAASYAMPSVLHLTSITHVSAGGSGDEMLRWGTYLTVTEAHPVDLPVVQKALSATAKEFGFVSGFDGNVWALLNEYCAITRQDVSFLDSKLTVTPRIASLSAPRGTFSKFSRDSERREKYKQVAIVNQQSKAVTTNDAVLWRADSVFQVAAREVFETTVETGHSILSLVQPVPVTGIWPFPYTTGAGQYVVTGADGYIIAPEWWNDNGGKVEVSLTGKAGEIAIKIIAPTIDTVRAPYRISEGEGDRPALYVSGSGILNDPKEVHVGTGATNAKEGFDSVFESPFMAGAMETYDTAAAMASEYSAAMADVTFELPNDFYTPSRFGQYPAGTRFTDGKRNYRITSASQSHSRVSGSAVPHTTIGEYVASFPPDATIADEKARHAGRTIKQVNIQPLRSSNA
jgi:hypothetical protein